MAMPRNNDEDAYVHLQGRYAQLVNGTLKIEDLDDEEVSRGELRASDGTFRGRKPKMVPATLIAAMKREWIGRAQSRLQAALLTSGIGVMVELANDPLVDAPTRLRAAQMITERTMGKVPDKVVVASEDPIDALFRGILSDPLGLDRHEPSAEERALL